VWYDLDMSPKSKYVRVVLWILGLVLAIPTLISLISAAGTDPQYFWIVFFTSFYQFLLDPVGYVDELNRVLSCCS